MSRLHYGPSVYDKEKNHSLTQKYHNGDFSFMIYNFFISDSFFSFGVEHPVALYSGSFAQGVNALLEVESRLDTYKTRSL